MSYSTHGQAARIIEDTATIAEAVQQLDEVLAL